MSLRLLSLPFFFFENTVSSLTPNQYLPLWNKIHFIFCACNKDSNGDMLHEVFKHTIRTMQVKRSPRPGQSVERPLPGWHLADG